MIDIFMLIMIIILAVVIIIINIYLLAYYCSVDDNEFGSGILAKLIAIIGLFIGLGQICLLPLDISNTRGEGGDFRMDFIWKIAYILIACFVFLIIPLAISLYECDPEWSFCKKLLNSLCFLICKLVVVGCLIVVPFLFWNKAHIPITSLKCKIDINNEWTDSDKEISDNEKDFETFCGEVINTEIDIKVSFPICVIAFLSVISYIHFMIFGGVGIFSFPLDLINSFCTRPLKVKPAKLEEMKTEIALIAADFKDIAIELKKLEKNGDHNKFICSKERRYYNKLLKKLKVGVSVIYGQFQKINMHKSTNQTSALGFLLQLIFGLFCFILSLLWICQIIFYILISQKGRKPFYLFLNKPLVKLTDMNLSFLAIGLYTVFTFYLLLITIKGNFKFGIRFLFLGPIHPLEKDNTYMNSILFNVMLVMITSVSVIQFSIRAFGEYTSLTDADIIFNTQIKYLTFYRLFFKYNIFEYGLLFIAFISFFYLICSKNDANSVKDMLNKKIFNEKKDYEEQLIYIRDGSIN